MKHLFNVLLSVTCVATAAAQSGMSLQSSLSGIYTAAALSDSTSRNKAVNTWWADLQNRHQIPLIVGDSVAFLYKGDARTVEWMGDFNGWGSAKKKVDNKGKRIPGTSIWILKASFPSDTRLDYKIVLNGNNWILDPDNKLQQWSGVGGGSPNSELCMPMWKEDNALTSRGDIPHGQVSEDILLNSKILGYQVMYNVYIPANAKGNEKFPVLFVTDGYEYMHPRLGDMITVLDNLIAEKRIKPVVVVFVDHREPVNRANNKRMDELAMNPKYLRFFEDELIPSINTNYPVSQAAADRGIMGCSMGGLNAAYFAFSKPGVFGLAGIQSPAFWIRPQIYAVCNSAEHPMKVSLTSGVINDASEGTRKMGDILATNACDYKYHEVNDGHSWGNWRNLIDDVLIDLYGT